ncbi:hypothetical protein AB0D12_32015 [Streptomyces sp. NPDC048479]|uniref:hypothetical protein n=1 Tax=Streptomyces sp. NPDC048479 TaxID=3154725 RepID=UPI0034429816
MAELTEQQRAKRRQDARDAIATRLRDTWKSWRRPARTPDFDLAADLAVDALGYLAAEILADGTLLKAMDIKDGVLTLETEPAREILLTLVASMRGMLDGYGAENYLETEMIASNASVSLDMRDGKNPTDDYTVTIQRRTRPTPHEFRQKAEARVTQLEARLTNAKKLVDGWQQASQEHAQYAQSKVMDDMPGMADKQDGRSNQLADCANELNDVLNGEDPDDWEYGIGMDVTEVSDRDG